MNINFKATRTETQIIVRICERAEAIESAFGTPLNRRVQRSDRLMDLTACHLNGCKLDLLRMLECDQDFDFVHDVFGITRHINRETGKLENCFLPRFAVKQTEAA